MQQKSDRSGGDESSNKITAQSAAFAFDGNRGQCFDEVAAVQKSDSKDSAKLDDDLKKFGTVGTADGSVKRQQMVNEYQMSCGRPE